MTVTMLLGVQCRRQEGGGGGGGGGGATGAVCPGLPV